MYLSLPRGELLPRATARQSARLPAIHALSFCGSFGFLYAPRHSARFRFSIRRLQRSWKAPSVALRENSVDLEQPWTWTTVSCARPKRKLPAFGPFSQSVVPCLCRRGDLCHDALWLVHVLSISIRQYC